MKRPRHGEIDPRALADDALVYRLLRLVNLLAKPFAQLYGERYKLSLQEWRIMLALAAHPGATATEISDRTGVHLMNVSRSIARLHRMKRVAREVDPADKRRRLLRLSPAGEKLFREIAPGAQARERVVHEALSAAELRSLRQMLDKMIERLREEPG
ncbi:MAG: MarR family winged helix-turn-helix transcriptional regulator [Burkholderiaceae bacterium]|nr:MarR family winged helix-turn-helix transcriptional regulator [Burkholderiaceae bacterium]